MKIYSPTFFKDDFTENKNRLKNPDSPKGNKEPIPYKKVENNTDLKIKKKSFSLKTIDRINKLKEYFTLKVSEYFNEEVV